MNVAILCSAHGFGHTGRQLALAEALLAEGSAVRLYTAVPPARFAEDAVGIEVVPWTIDVGIQQRDSVTEDPEGTVARVEAVVTDAAIDRLAASLAGVDVAVVDIAPAALEACRRAGVPAIAVGNFDWAWVYGHYPALAPWVDRWRAWQAPHDACFVGPGPGLFGFRSVRTFGVLGRRRPPVRVADTAVLVSFGGFGLEGIDALLPRVDGVRWVLATPMPALDRPDVIHVTGVSYAALVAGADAVLTKPGYGIYAEAALAGTRLVWVDRGAFPEAPYLEAAMHERGDEKVGADGVAAAVLRRLARPRPSVVAEGTALAPARAIRRG